MELAEQIARRSALEYADFLTPHLTADAHVLDLGCGDGGLSAGLLPWCGRVTALDASASEFPSAAATLRLDMLAFVQADAGQLPFRDGTFDAVMAHSVLEAGVNRTRVLAEAHRVLKPGGLFAAASVDYGGLLLAGPDVELLRRSNEIRQEIWLRSEADPFLGRSLRGLVTDAGFVDVEATTKTFSYGTPSRVGEFAAGRAAECADAEFVAAAVDAGLSTMGEMADMASAWSRWAGSDAAYAAFTWGRVICRRPGMSLQADGR